MHRRPHAAPRPVDPAIGSAGSWVMIHEECSVVALKMMSGLSEAGWAFQPVTTLGFYSHAIRVSAAAAEALEKTYAAR